MSAVGLTILDALGIGCGLEAACKAKHRRTRTQHGDDAAALPARQARHVALHDNTKHLNTQAINTRQLLLTPTCLNRMAALRPAGPAPTISRSNFICSRACCCCCAAAAVVLRHLRAAAMQGRHCPKLLLLLLLLAFACLGRRNARHSVGVLLLASADC